MQVHITMSLAMETLVELDELARAKRLPRSRCIAWLLSLARDPGCEPGVVPPTPSLTLLPSPAQVTAGPSGPVPPAGYQNLLRSAPPSLATVNALKLLLRAKEGELGMGGSQATDEYDQTLGLPRDE